jgi:transcription factor HY5
VFRCHRLLRNRVSAQQARERKKSFLSTLQAQTEDQQMRITELEARLNKAERENNMLRSILKGMQNPTIGMQQGLPSQPQEAAVPVHLFH